MLQAINGEESETNLDDGEEAQKCSSKRRCAEESEGEEKYKVERQRGVGCAFLFLNLIKGHFCPFK